MRLAVALAVALALLVVPAANAAGPSITYTVISGTPGDNGWYRSPVSAQINVGGATSSTCPAIYSPQSNTDPALDCSGTDGVSTVSLHLKFKIDTDAPTVTGPGPSRGPDANGWYNHPVAFAFTGSDGTSGIASCTTLTYGGPDSGSASVSGSCRDVAGNVSATASYALRYDATPPTVTASADRKADARGWFTKPVTISFAGTDAASGIASCTTPVHYTGPDTTTPATIGGSCTDTAGNSAGASLALLYDATPPRLARVSVAVGNGTARLSWRQPRDTVAVVVVRSPGRRGRSSSRVYDGHQPAFRDRKLRPGLYRYLLRSRDHAGNVWTTRLRVDVRALYAPAPGARVRPGARLAWTSVPHTSYYNLQLFRGRRKVLSAWPVGTSFRLPRHWAYRGRRYSLARGTYRWYVWPGRGPRSRAAYGPLLGSSSFRVR